MCGIVCNGAHRAAVMLVFGCAAATTKKIKPRLCTRVYMGIENPTHDFGDGQLEGAWFLCKIRQKNQRLKLVFVFSLKIKTLQGTFSTGLPRHN